MGKAKQGGMGIMEKEKLYSKALKQMNKQFKKRGIQFSFVKPINSDCEVENEKTIFNDR